MSGGYTVDINWAGKRWRFDDVPVELVEHASIGDAAADPVYRASMSLPMGDTQTRVLDQGGAELCTVVVSNSEGRLVSFGTPSTMKPARSGELTDLTIGVGTKRRKSYVPAEHRIARTVFDAEATEAYTEMVEANREFLAQHIPYEQGLAGDDNNYADLYATEDARNLFYADGSIPVEFRDQYERQIDGLVFPMVIGRPGREGTPALRLLHYDDSAQQAVVAGHPMTGGKLSLYLRQDDGNRYSYTGQQATVGTFSLNFGNVIPGSINGLSVALLDGADDDLNKHDGGGLIEAYQAANRSLYGAFTESDGAAGHSGTGPDVLELLLGMMQGTPLDRSTLEANRSVWLPYQLDAVVSERTELRQLLESQVLPVLPAALQGTPLGVGVVPIIMSTDRALAVRGDLAVGSSSTLAAMGPWSWREPSAASVRLRFSYNVMDGGYRSLETATPRMYGDTAARLGSSRLGVHRFESAWIYDRGTAALVARDMQLRHCLPRYELVTMANPVAHGADGRLPIRTGEVWRLRDDDDGGRLHLVTPSQIRRVGDDLQVTWRRVGAG